jgi:NTE family protein
MKKTALFVFLFFSFLSSFSQDIIKKPKIGLVLSGGGAKGFAHIGVLKVLEQAGVKIDYIGGTSMGAVVGGLYASGYSATQIDSIFKTINFDNLLQDFIPRTSKNFYEKRNDELYGLVLPFYKFKIGIPEALSKGMYNFNSLSSLTRSVRHIQDFNELKIPFLCMATNIETGEPVTLNKGNLAYAMIASSAFPSLFSPLEMDGNLIVDGGVANNYPVEEVRKMGADLIIGVDVQEGLLNRTELKDAAKILGQVTTLQSIEKMKAKISATDIYIKPDTKSFRLISFDKRLDIIKKGEEASFAVYEQLKKYASVDYKPNNLKTTVDSLQINNILINNLKNYTRSYIKGKLGFKEGEKISYTDLKIGIDNLNATHNFSAINYSFENKDSKDDIKLTLTENDNTSFLKFALHYDELFKTAVLVNLTQKKNFFKNDIASLDIVLGDNLRYNLDYYIDNGFYWSFGFKSYLNQFNRNVAKEVSGLYPDSSDIKAVNVDFSDLTNQVYMQTVFAQKFLIGTGVEFKFLNINSETLSGPSTIIDKSTYLSAFGYVKYDSFDNKHFPKKGWFFSGNIQSYLLSSDYTKIFNPFSIAKADFAIAKTVLNKITTKFQAETGFSFGNKSLPFFNFALGGFGYATLNNFRPFYGYNFLGIAANSYLKASTTVDYEIFKKNHINFSANFANLQDNLFQSFDWLSIPKYSGYALGYGLETIIGPIEIKQSWSPETRQGYTWFSVGFWF